jgi:hypothetical protein
MNDFSSRWRTLNERARRAADRAAETADAVPVPHGFATRVLARAGLGNRDELSVPAAWWPWLQGALAASCVLLAGVVLLDWRAPAPAVLGPTGVENTVAQIVWSL